MNKEITLQENIEKVKRMLKEIERLSNPELYYNSNYPPQYKCDKRNKRHLKKAVKKVKKLINAINKQAWKRL